MRRNLIIGFAGLGVLCLVLSLATAWVGSELDNERLKGGELSGQLDTLQTEVEAVTKERDALKKERDALKHDAEALRTDRDTIKTDREALKARTEAQLDTIAQLNKELEQLRSRVEAAGTAATSTH